MKSKKVEDSACLLSDRDFVWYTKSTKRTGNVANRYPAAVATYAVGQLDLTDVASHETRREALTRFFHSQKYFGTKSFLSIIAYKEKRLESKSDGGITFKLKLHRNLRNLQRFFPNTSFSFRGKFCIYYNAVFTWIKQDSLQVDQRVKASWNLPEEIELVHFDDAGLDGKDYASVEPLFRLQFKRCSFHIHFTENVPSPSNELWMGGCIHTQMLWESEHTKDLSLVAKTGRELKCHQMMLFIQSPILTATASEWTGHGRIRMEMSEDGLDLFLRAMYGFEINALALSCDMAVELFEASGKYEVDGLHNSLRELLMERDMNWFSLGNLMQLYKYSGAGDIKVDVVQRKVVWIMSCLPKNDVEASALGQELKKGQVEELFRKIEDCSKDK